MCFLAKLYSLILTLLEIQVLGFEHKEFMRKVFSQSIWKTDAEMSLIGQGVVQISN